MEVMRGRSKFFANARVMPRRQDAQIGADSGRGRQFAAVEQPGATGASSSAALKAIGAMRERRAILFMGQVAFGR